jgi:hypothetical protein
MSTDGERRPPIGPVLSQMATLLAEWWLGFTVTQAEDPSDGIVPDDPSELTADNKP